MALNASIFGNMLAQPKSPEEYLAERQQLEQGKMTNMLNRQKLDEYSRGVERQNQLRNLLATGADSNALRQAGFVKEADDWDSNSADVAYKRAQTTKVEGDALSSRLEESRKLLSMIQTPEQYIAWHEGNHKDPVLGPFLAARGITADQSRQNITTALNTPGGLEQLIYKSSVGLDAFNKKLQEDAKISETGRHNKATEGIQIRGQNMVDARAKEANKLRADEIASGGKPPPGYRWNSDGTLTAIPGGPGDKLPESQQKQVVGVQNLSNAINEYRQSLKSFGKVDALKPDQRAMMGTKYNNMMLQAKEAYNLGVLNGPDYDILQAVITDPRSVTGLITSNSALDKQASELDRIMRQVASTSSQIKPRGAPAQPSDQAPKAGDVEGGYRFKGGDPSNKSNWEKVQ